jgi:hypothetical protein
MHPLTAQHTLNVLWCGVIESIYKGHLSILAIASWTKNRADGLTHNLVETKETFQSYTHNTKKIKYN